MCSIPNLQYIFQRMFDRSLVYMFNAPWSSIYTVFSLFSCLILLLLVVVLLLLQLGRDETSFGIKHTDINRRQTLVDGVGDEGNLVRFGSQKGTDSRVSKSRQEGQKD